jgi:integrase
MPRPRIKPSNLPPCLYQKHGAYYYVKRGDWKRLGSTLQDALVAYAELVDTVEGTMPRLIDDALGAMRLRNPPLSQNTLKQYAGAAKILKRKLKQFRPEQVQSKHVAAIKASMLSTPNMANRCLSFLRGVFDYAVEQQLVPNNPCVGIKRLGERERDRLIEREEYERIYAKAGPRLQVIMDLAIRVGQRITAILRIKRSDLTPEGVRFGRHKTPTKGVVKWTPELREIVERAKELRGGAVTYLTYLLPSRKGDKPPDYRSVKLQWDTACKAAGVDDAHLHDLRAVAATEAEDQGLNPTALLQHTSEKQTRRYLRSKREPLVEAPSFRQSKRQG